MGGTASKDKKKCVQYYPIIKKETRDATIQVGAIDFLEEGSAITSVHRPSAYSHSILASASVSHPVTKEMVPVASLSQPARLHIGDCATEGDSCRSHFGSLRRQGDCASETGSREQAEAKWVQPITYQIRMKILESSLARLLFMELYGLDLRQMSEQEFVQWTQVANLPRTARMYEKFQFDALNYALRRNLTALENRFNVRVTMGDCLPLTRNGQKLNDIPSKERIRELIFYGEGPYRINSAVNYFAATLNQLKSDQLLLPNDRKFSLQDNANLLPWIAPQPPDAVEPVLVRLRKQALLDIGEDTTTCSSQY